VELRVVEEPLVGQVLEGAAGLRGALGVQRDLEVAAVRGDRGDVGLARRELLLGLGELADVLGARIGDRLAAGLVLLRLRGLGRRGRVLALVVAAGGDQQGADGEQDEEPRHGGQA
jgi:hypothetical protein